MTGKKKRQLKRRLKILMWIAYCSIFMFLSMILYLTQTNNIDLTDNRFVLFVGTTLTLLPIIAVISSIWSNLINTKLIFRLDLIRKYRARMFAMRTIEFLKENKLQEAIDEFKKCDDYPDKQFENYIYGLIHAACYYSNIEKVNNIGLEKINEIIGRFSPDEYNPNKIK